MEHYRQETVDFGDCDPARPAWAFGSVTARKAWASMARVMCRYQALYSRTW